MPDLPAMDLTPDAIATLLSTLAEQKRLIELLQGRVEALECRAPASHPPSTEAASVPLNPSPPPTETPVTVDTPSERADSTPPATPSDAHVDVSPAATTEPKDSGSPNTQPPNEEKPPAAPNAPETTGPSAPVTPSPSSTPPVPAPHGTLTYPSIFAPHPIVHHYPPHFYYQQSSFYPPPWHASPNGAASPGGPIPSEGGGSERGAAPGTPSVNGERRTTKPEACPKSSPSESAPITPQDTTGAVADTRSDSGRAGVKKCKRVCTFDVDCTRKACWFVHPGRGESVDNSTQGSVISDNSSTSGSASGSGRAPRTNGNSKRACRSGMSCTRTVCRFDHPPGWNTSNTAPEAQTEGTWGEDHQAAEPAADSATNDGWGDIHASQTAEVENTEDEDANSDFGNWGAAPAADWGFPASNDWDMPAENSWGASTSNDHSTSAKNDKESSEKEDTTKPREEEDSKKEAQKVERPVASTSDTVATATPSRAPSPQPTELTNAATLDALDTPSLDHADTPSTSPAPSESEFEPPAPPFSWADEPCAISVASSNTLREMQPSSPQIQLPEDSLPDVPTEDDTDDTNPIDDPVDLDKFAPSNIYDSWAPSVADWGFPVEETAVTNDADPQADHDTFAPKEDYSWGDPPSEPEDNGTKSKKTVSSVDTARSDSRSGGFDNKSSVKAKGKGKGRGKGKGKENPPSQTNTISQSENKNGSGSGSSKSKPAMTPVHSITSPSTASTAVSSASTSAPSTPPTDPMSEPPLSVLPVLQAPPPGVPEEEIPDWLLGVGEDSHKSLGLSRAPTPEPPSPVVAQPAPLRPRLHQIPGDSFPALIPPPIHTPAATSVADGPLIRSRRTGWRVLPDPPAPADNNGANRGSGQQQRRNYNGKKRPSTSKVAAK